LAPIRERRPLEVRYDEDFQTWEAYKHRENFRWMFNKLEVAFRQRLHCGPAGTAPEQKGFYVSRPVYNVYGMGIGAQKFFYDPETDAEDFTNHSIVPPGHFWCEWLEGPQLSIDYQLFSDNTWEATSIWVGHHKSDDNLTQFDRWERHPTVTAPSSYLLPIKFPWNGVGATYIERELVHGFNVEMRSNKIIEIHLRHGNDVYDHLPEGTVITPVWDDDEVPEGTEFLANLTEAMTDNGAHGNLSNIRRGFIVTRPSE